MPFTVTMPKLSPTMEEGTLVKWHYAVGDYVEAGSVLIEVATDKATVEFNALDSGWLRKILVPEGKSAIVNQAIGIFTESKEESIEGYKPKGVQPEAPKKAGAEEAGEAGEEEKVIPEEYKTASSRGKTATLQQPSFVPEKPLEGYSFEFPTEATQERVRASPLARKLAKEKGLDLSSVKGTGPNLRVVSRDLEKAQQLGSLGPGRHEAPSIAPGTYEEEALTPMRKVIGQRLQESKSFVPHFYVQHTIDAEKLVALREQLISSGVKLTVNDFIMRATALTLRKHPQVNSGFDTVNQSIIRFKTIDISIAVSLPSGLITPIVRHADYKSIDQLSVEMRSLSKRAKEGKLEPHEYRGGSFTISNLGMYGVTNFQAIINPPQAAILAVGGIQDAPVVKEGKVVPGKVLQVSLSVDHRVIDGVAAAEFLRDLKQVLEAPAMLLL